MGNPLESELSVLRTAGLAAFGAFVLFFCTIVFIAHKECTVHPYEVVSAKYSYEYPITVMRTVTEQDFEVPKGGELISKEMIPAGEDPHYDHTDINFGVGGGYMSGKHGAAVGAATESVYGSRTKFEPLYTYKIDRPVEVSSYTVDGDNPVPDDVELPTLSSNQKYGEPEKKFTIHVMGGKDGKDDFVFTTSDVKYANVKVGDTIKLSASKFILGKLNMENDVQSTNVKVGGTIELGE